MKSLMFWFSVLLLITISHTAPYAAYKQTNGIHVTYFHKMALNVSGFSCVLVWFVTYLHQTALHVSSFRCFDSSVHQTLSTSHCVEEKLGRGQSGIETVLHKSTSSWILRCKMFLFFLNHHYFIPF
jgi:hypothetical protein